MYAPNLNMASDGYWKSTDNAFNLNVDNLSVLSSLSLQGSGTGQLTLDASAVTSSYQWKFPSTIGTAGQVLTSQGGGTMTWTSNGSGSGSVTSVGMTVPTFLSVTPSAITTSGTFAVTLSGTALPVLNGGTGVTTSTGSGSNVLNTSPTLSTISLNQGASAQAAIIYPVSNNDEASLFFLSQTTNTGGRWSLGHNVGGIAGSDTFSLYSTTTGSNLVVFTPTSSTFATPVNSTMAGSSTKDTNFLAPSLGVGNAVNLNLGTANSVNNSAVVQFVNVGGANSANNSLNMGVYGVNSITIKPASTSFYTQMYSYGTLISSTRYHIYFQSGATETGKIYDNGSTVTYFSASDYRLKSEVEPLYNSLERIMQLKPCAYIWNNTSLPGEGFLAHEIQQVVPLAVSGVKDEVDEEGKIKTQGVDYSKLTPLLTAALQELYVKVEQQQLLINELIANKNV